MNRNNIFIICIKNIFSFPISIWRRTLYFRRRSSNSSKYSNITHVYPISIVNDWNILSLQVFALFSHLLLTCVLIWTRTDNISTTLPLKYQVNDMIINTDNYDQIDSAYLTLISIGIIFIIFRLVVFLRTHLIVNIYSIICLFLDCIGCLFVAWMILDGFNWYYYGFILALCVLFPALKDLLTISGSFTQYLMELSKLQNTQ